jgi:GntR family transcriptional regulator
MTSGTATFTVERLTHRGDGRPVDLESVQLRGDRLTLSTTLDRDR